MLCSEKTSVTLWVSSVLASIRFAARIALRIPIKPIWCPLPSSDSLILILFFYKINNNDLFINPVYGNMNNQCPVDYLNNSDR